MKVSAFLGLSLDGFIAGPKGELDWLTRVEEIPGEDYGFKAFMDSVDALVMGRKTYERVIQFDEWPYTGKRVIVISKTRKEVRPDVELFHGEIKALLEKLMKEGLKQIYADGGITVSRMLSQALLHELTVTIIPILLGAGIPLFCDLGREVPLKLINAKSYSNGIVQLHYRA